MNRTFHLLRINTCKWNPLLSKRSNYFSLKYEHAPPFKKPWKAIYGLHSTDSSHTQKEACGNILHPNREEISWGMARPYLYEPIKLFASISVDFRHNIPLYVQARFKNHTYTHSERKGYFTVEKSTTSF